VSKPKWVRGFDTEDDAKAARDEACVRAPVLRFQRASGFNANPAGQAAPRG
jgi:hypothetical protein